MKDSLSIIGAPSSAGSYAPGQEKAPSALREIGLGKFLSDQDIVVEDEGDVPGFRWRADKDNPSAMNANASATVALAVADRVQAALAGCSAVLVLGGDCTVELGTVSGALRASDSVGLVYIDLDTDMKTPESTNDGALDWMGVAHMLGVNGTVPQLSTLGPRTPMLRPDQILFFATKNVTASERAIIEELSISEVSLREVAADPRGAADAVRQGWAREFERLLIHLDVDVLDFADMPLAEETRRNVGLQFDQLMEALGSLLEAPNWTALTICEVNPDHGERDGSTLKTFAQGVASALAHSPRLRQ